MSDPEPSPVEFLGDPLSQLARDERRNLMLASAIGLLVGQAGLLPQQISALGITFTAPEQRTLLLCLAGAVTYFLLAFLTVGSSDYLVWRKKYQDYLERVVVKLETWTQDDQKAYDELRQKLPKIRWLYVVSRPVALVRQVFEFVVPVAFGVYVAIALAARAHGA
jgi:hypothetical protein